MARRKRPKDHVIADIHYEPHNGPSWLVCTDGTRLDAETPDALAVAFVRHGGKSSRADSAPKVAIPAVAKSCQWDGCDKLVETSRHWYCITHRAVAAEAPHRVKPGGVRRVA